MKKIIRLGPNHIEVHHTSTVKDVNDNDSEFWDKEKTETFGQKGLDRAKAAAAVSLADLSDDRIAEKRIDAQELIDFWDEVQSEMDGKL